MLKTTLLILLSLFAIPLCAQQQSIDWWVIGSGYTAGSDSTYHLLGTAGQTAIELDTNQFYTYSQGFWHPYILVSGVDISETITGNSDVSVYPNPSSDNMSFKFSLKTDSRVSIKVLGLLGFNTVELLDNPMSQGIHSITWNGTSMNGNSLPNGLYICEIRICPNASNECTNTQTKLIIMK